jgi:aryl-alcohol dehydrogenase
VIVRAAVARAPHAPLTLETLELEEPRDDEVLVRLVATGVCHTDIAARDRAIPVPQPVVLGHEGAGIVERVGAGVAKVVPGDHVVLTYDACGACASCSVGAPTYCYEFFKRNLGGSRADGSTTLSAGHERVHGNFFGQSSFASMSLCRERNVVKVRRDVDLALLGPLGCGVQTGAGTVMNALRVEAGASLAVFGSGAVGLSAILAARAVGATTIVAVDVNASRLDLARELGATHAVNAATTDPAKEILRLTGAGVAYAIEATGLAPVIRQAVDSLAPRGVCAVVGAAARGAEVSLDVSHLMTGGRTVRGVVEGESHPDTFIPALIELYRSGRFPFDRLVRYYAFEDINAAIADSEAGTAVKAIVRHVAL